MAAKDLTAAMLASWKKSEQLGLPILAGGVAFFIFVAIAPIITASVMLYAWFGEAQTVGQRVSALEWLLPNEVTATIGQHLELAVKHSVDSGPTAFAFALTFALYCGLMAVRGFIAALNQINRVEETRRLRVLIPQQIAITAIGLALGVIALMAGAALTWLLTRTPFAYSQSAGAVIDLLFWVMLLIIGGTGFLLLLRTGPNKAAPPLRATLPGACFAMATSLLSSFLFSYYVAHIYDYSATYGSASALVVLLMWIYLSCFAILLGASLNYELEVRIDRRSA